VAGPLGQTWERLESWPLFTAGFDLLVHAGHPLATQNDVSLESLKGERLLNRVYCEIFEQTQSLLREHGINASINHQIANDDDLLALLEAQVGIAIVPDKLLTGPALRHVQVRDLDLKAPVSVYGVAGRQRSAVANTFIKLLRSADWTALERRGTSTDSAA
jgi:DNA-binding transcriptional LysR family regulator